MKKKINVTYTKEEPKRKYVYKDAVINLPDLSKGWRLVYDYARPNVDIPHVWVAERGELVVTLRKELPEDNIKLRKAFGVKNEKVKLEVKNI